MKHSSIVIFDTLLRSAWFSESKFPLSSALYASAKLGSLRRQLHLF